MPDPFNLERFVAAQAPVMEAVRAELRAGAKRSHWMWFVFPQVAGLGRSPTAQFYALSGLEEAGEFLRHPVLGSRLLECTGLVNAARGRSLREVFGSPDDLKFHSCMTLFARLPGDAPADVPGGGVFQEALERWFAGREDAGTVGVLG